MVQNVAACCSVLRGVAVCCGVLRCVAVCCGVLRCVQSDAVCCSVLKARNCSRGSFVVAPTARMFPCDALCAGRVRKIGLFVLQCVAVCCSVLKAVLVCSFLVAQTARMWCSACLTGVRRIISIAVCCIVLQCIAVCCSVL